MDASTFNAGLRGRLFAALTGRPEAVTGAGADVTGLLQAAFGTGARGRVNTRAAAAELGVSQRTVQRWIAGEGRQRNRPRADHLKSLRTKARQAASTQRGRRQAIASTRQSARSRYGARLNIKGVMGPSRAGTDYLRDRRILLQMTPEAVEGLLDAYEQGGDRGLVTWLEGYADREYLEDWTFGTITDFSLDDPRS